MVALSTSVKDAASPTSSSGQTSQVLAAVQEQTDAVAALSALPLPSISTVSTLKMQELQELLKFLRPLASRLKGMCAEAEEMLDLRAKARAQAKPAT